MDKKEPEHFSPTNQKEWRIWLELNHTKKDSVWLIFHKKGSDIPTLSWSEAVDQALCFGWIDSLKKPVDDKRYKQYFGRRKPQSTWSKINKEKSKKLIEAGLMKEAGFKSIELAKQNGSWSILDTVENLEIPKDLEQAFKQYPGSKDYYDGLSKSFQKGFLHWVALAKKPETRNKRIREIVENACQNLKPKHFR